MEWHMNVGNETLDNEYKEFTFNHGGLEVDSDNAEKLIQSSYWCFNDMILEAIRKYFKVYIPKYASAFLNKEALIDTGNFYIGISDNGTVYGIPFQGKLCQDFLQTELDLIIKKYVKSSNLGILKKSISLELLEIKYTPMKISKYSDSYYKYLKYKKKLEKKDRKYNLILNFWNVMHFKYAQKLVDIFNLPETREELLNYIIKKEPTNNVIQMINSGFQLQIKNHEEINELKNFINEPYYWVCKFKDELLDEVRKQRPIRDNKNILVNLINPINILIKISNMIPWWMQNNENMKLYVIKINFRKNKDNTNIYYLDSFGKINKCYRNLEFNKPYCQPVY
jgi:hypothetical protein